MRALKPSLIKAVGSAPPRRGALVRRIRGGGGHLGRIAAQ